MLSIKYKIVDFFENPCWWTVTNCSALTLFTLKQAISECWNQHPYLNRPLSPPDSPHTSTSIRFDPVLFPTNLPKTSLSNPTPNTPPLVLLFSSPNHPADFSVTSPLRAPSTPLPAPPVPPTLPSHSLTNSSPYIALNIDLLLPFKLLSNLRSIEIIEFAVQRLIEKHVKLMWWGSVPSVRKASGSNPTLAAK